MDQIKLRNHTIGEGHPTYVIAEMSANHAGSIDRAKEIIHAAAQSGADCIKIQTYTPDTLTIDCHNSYFQVQNGTWEGENLYSLYGKAYTPWEWQAELKAEADRAGIDFLSTPFDRTSVDFLEEMGLDFYKIASFEMVDIPLLKYVASKGKPIILSTGMGSLEEIREAVEAVYSTGNHQLVLLKCSSAYPADPAQMNLRTISDLQRRFDLPVGLSDHSMGSMSAVTAVALGAKVIEKHFCISREIENPDASFSMTPQEFKEMVGEIRRVEQALGQPFYGMTPQEETSKVFRRSIFAVKDIQPGEALTPENIRIIRPGYGLKPKYMEDILGWKTDRKLERGTPVTFEALEKGSVLFLSNNDNTRPLQRWLEEQGERVHRIENKLTVQMVEELAPAFVISYNYKHLIPQEVLDLLTDRIINLHTSYLPYNRGAAPNFFSFWDGTPLGVTIHQMSAGLDQGDILCQRELIMDEKTETFASSYEKLQKAMFKVFTDSWADIKNGRLTPSRQQGEGTYHRSRELEEIRKRYPFTWDQNIAEYLRRSGRRES